MAHRIGTDLVSCWDAIRRWIVPIIVGWWMLISWVVIILPVSGTVVEEVTGQPVSNAVVLATWATEKFSLEEMQYAGAYRVIEVETDAGGAYRIPGWVGLDIKSPFRWRSAQDSPQLVVYAPGYRHVIAHNQGRSHFIMVRHSESSGKSIPLPRVKPSTETPEGYQSDDAINSYMTRTIAERGMTESFDGRLECHWDRYAKILSAMWSYEESPTFTGKVTRHQFWPGILKCRQENLFSLTAVPPTLPANLTSSPPSGGG